MSNMFKEYVSFKEKLTEIIKKNKGDVKNAYARVDVGFKPRTLTLSNGEVVTIYAEINYNIDKEITEISFTLMRKLIDEGYMKFKCDFGTVLIYEFYIEKFIDFEEALKK